MILCLHFSLFQQELSILCLQLILCFQKFLKYWWCNWVHVIQQKPLTICSYQPFPLAHGTQHKLRRTKHILDQLHIVMLVDSNVTCILSTHPILLNVQLMVIIMQYYELHGFKENSIYYGTQLIISKHLNTIRAAFHSQRPLNKWWKILSLLDSLWKAHVSTVNE